MAPSIPAQLVLGHGQTNSSVYFIIRLFASFWRTWLEVVLVWVHDREF
jgi:hypothetical protein